MRDKEAEAQAILFFEAIGGRVARINEVPGQRRADLRVTMLDAAYLVEVKGKQDNETYSQALADHGEAIRTDHLSRSNSVARQIREGVEQLRATPGSSDDFRFLVLLPSDDAYEVEVEQFKADSVRNRQHCHTGARRWGRRQTLPLLHILGVFSGARR